MTTYDVAAEVDQVNVRHLAGTAFRLVLPVLDDGGPVAAGAIASARAQVRPSIGNERILHTFSTENDPPDIAVLGTTAAELELTASSQTTTEWALLWPGRPPATAAWWDVEITDQDGTPHQLVVPGQFVVVHQVTR